MNLRRKIVSVRFNRAILNYEKYLSQSKIEARSPQNWDLEKIAQASDLIEEGNGSNFYMWSPVFEEDKPFKFSDYLVSSLKKTFNAEVLRARSIRAYRQRNGVWQKVFAFLPEHQIPTLAGREYVLGHESFEEEDRNTSVGVATFGYPVKFDTPTIGKEMMCANFETYESVLDTIRDRMGLSNVVVEPVGSITDQGVEINGTVGDSGFRVWFAHDDEKPLFDTSSGFAWSTKMRIRIAAKIRSMVGLKCTFFDSSLVRNPKECDGVFRVITIVSEANAPQEYMKRIDDIRTILDVPGVMIAPFGPLNDDRRLESGTSSERDENGVYHTALIFYTGNETEVVMNHVDLDEDGNSIAAISGFMPIHSVKHLLSKWEKKTAPEVQPETSDAAV